MLSLAFGLFSDKFPLFKGREALCVGQTNKMN